MSALTFFRFFTETYSSTPLSLRFFFLPMAPRSIGYLSRPPVVVMLLFLLDLLGLLGGLGLVLLHQLLAFYLR